MKKNNLKSHNKKPKIPRKLTEEEVAHLIELYQSGYTLSELEETVNHKCTASSIRGLLARRKVKLRRRGKKCNFNEDYFEIIDTANKAYIYGFLYADGSVYGNTVAIGINTIDSYILEFIMRELNSENGINRDIRYSTFGMKDISHISFTSEKMVKDLMKYGMVYQKSIYAEKIPELASDLVRHFIRGYFDGNGTVYIDKKSQKNKFGFYSTESLLLKIQKLLSEEINLSVNKIYKKEGCYLLSYSKKKDIVAFYNYIYDNAEIYLKRKKDKFINFN